VEGHIEAAKLLGKPLCLQEFGKKPAGPDRAKLFKKVGLVLGGLFWWGWWVGFAGVR